MDMVFCVVQISNMFCIIHNAFEFVIHFITDMVHLYKSGRQYLFGIDICYTFYFLCCIIYNSMERMVLLLCKDAKLYM